MSDSSNTNNNNNASQGGGSGVAGSGVAGGYEGNQSQDAGQGGEKQDWLDKSIKSAGQKFGVNINDANADKIGDFLNKEAKSTQGHNIPGVQ